LKLWMALGASAVCTHGLYARFVRSASSGSGPAGCRKVPCSQTSQAFTSEVFGDGRSRRRYTGCWAAQLSRSEVGAAPPVPRQNPRPAILHTRDELKCRLVAGALGRGDAISTSKGGGRSRAAAGSAGSEDRRGRFEAAFEGEASGWWGVTAMVGREAD
jgi:hypothetical protein